MDDKRKAKTDNSDSTAKVLVSFYLLHETFEKIDDILFYIKKRLPIEKRRRLTKTVFYEAGIQVLIEDYNAKGEESSLLKAIQKLIQNS